MSEFKSKPGAMLTSPLSHYRSFTVTTLTPLDRNHLLGLLGLFLMATTPVIGLTVCIVALRQSRRQGFENEPALWGVRIGIVVGGLAIAGVLIGILTAVFGPA